MADEPRDCTQSESVACGAPLVETGWRAAFVQAYAHSRGTCCAGDKHHMHSKGLHRMRASTHLAVENIAVWRCAVDIPDPARNSPILVPSVVVDGRAANSSLTSDDTQLANEGEEAGRRTVAVVRGGDNSAGGGDGGAMQGKAEDRAEKRRRRRIGEVR